MSPPRDYEHMDNWLFRPHDGTISPISSTSSSIGYFSGSDWTTDSSWMSYESLIHSNFQPPFSSPFRPISPPLPIMDVPHQSRRLSQLPQRERQSKEMEKSTGKRRLKHHKPEKKQTTKKHSRMLNNPVSA